MKTVYKSTESAMSFIIAENIIRYTVVFNDLSIASSTTKKEATPEEFEKLLKECKAVKVSEI